MGQTKTRGPGDSLHTVDLEVEKGIWKASVSPDLGSALVSLVLDLGKPMELIYDGHKTGQSGWRGLAPWLWPAVGRTLLDEERDRAERRGSAPDKGHYHWGNARWPMPIHGFAMRKPWRLESQGVSGSCAWATCALEDDGQTRRAYPFQFRLESTACVHRSFVSHSIVVRASESNEAPMPFSVGNHLTLDIRGGLGAELDECLAFSPCQEELPLMRCGLLQGNEVPRSLKGVPCSELLNGVVAGYASPPRVDLLVGALRIRISQKEVVSRSNPRRSEQAATAFVFYGDASKGFFCPEPWLGFPNSLNTGRGLVLLPPGESFEWAMEIHLISDPYLAE